jgi:hypothetical protein
MTDKPAKPRKKRKSGAQYRKERKIREQAAHEARVALLTAQGKTLDLKKLEDVPKFEPGNQASSACLAPPSGQECGLS